MKTKAGTELSMLNLKGKDYLPVAQRLVWFREERPDWAIETEFTSLNDDFAIARAVIRDASGRAIATAHKREDLKHFPDYAEKAETGAIGRAVALCGYGTQFAPELDEGPRIVDTPQPPRAVARVVASIPKVTAASSAPVALPKPKGNACECGNEMMVSRYNKDELYCNPKKGGCGARRVLS